VHVRYNTGRAIADNGAELAALIEGLDWPVERIALVGHSMGGLVARSACAHGGAWTERVTHTISLGTPHDGAPLAQAVHHLEAVLALAPDTRPFARFLGRRSAGIRDLRRGVRDTLLPSPARHCYVAATVSADAKHPVGRVLGDTLVLVTSACGDGEVHTLGGMHHLALLHHPKVRAQLQVWLGE
jgi:pimeloyl-ACP methyl ester carboxylesterase